MLPIRHQVQVICELDSFRQLLQDIDAESFAALLYVSSFISFVAVNREDIHKYSCWEKQRQHNSKIQHTVKQHFATLVNDHVFLNQGKNNPQDAFRAIWCLQLPLIMTELLGETQKQHYLTWHPSTPGSCLTHCTAPSRHSACSY